MWVDLVFTRKRLQRFTREGWRPGTKTFVVFSVGRFVHRFLLKRWESATSLAGEAAPSPPFEYCGPLELFLSASVLMKTYKGGYAVAVIKWQRGRSWVDRCVCSLSLPQWGLAQEAELFSPQCKHPCEYLGCFFLPSTDVLNSFCSGLVLQKVSVSFLSRMLKYRSYSASV